MIVIYRSGCCCGVDKRHWRAGPGFHPRRRRLIGGRHVGERKMSPVTMVVPGSVRLLSRGGGVPLDAKSMRRPVLRHDFRIEESGFRCNGGHGIG
jgi:hypothetical protein